MGTNSMMRRLKTSAAGVLAVIAATGFAPQVAHAAGGSGIEIERQDWTFSGMFGYYDRQQLRRGYKVYKNVCAACHGIKFLSFRNLGQPGGPEFPEAVVNQIAAEATVTDGPNDQGEMFERPGRPSDRIPSPFRNKQEARAVNNGAYPPDLSLITKARAVERDIAWYMFPVVMLQDIATQYQEQGSDYLYALLTGYVDPPEGFQLSEGMNYNAAYPGHQIAMAAPLVEGVVEYEDGTPATVEQYAKDVTAFLTWAAEPHMEERKKMGIRVLIYLAILAVLLYLSKRVLWSRLH